MRLVFPNIEYKEKAIEFVNEFEEDKSELAGTGGLDGWYISTSAIDLKKYNELCCEYGLE